MFRSCHSVNHVLQRHEDLFARGLCRQTPRQVAPMVVMPQPQPAYRIAAPQIRLPEIRPGELTRRFPAGITWARLVEEVRVIRHSGVLSRSPRDLSCVQFAWRRFCNAVKNMCEPSFWRFFLPLHQLSASAIDSALHCAHDTFSDRVHFTAFPRFASVLMVTCSAPHVCCMRSVEFLHEDKRKKLGDSRPICTILTLFVFVLMQKCTAPHAYNMRSGAWKYEERSTFCSCTSACRTSRFPPFCVSGRHVPSFRK